MLMDCTVYKRSHLVSVRYIDHGQKLEIAKAKRNDEEEKANTHHTNITSQ